MKLRKFVRFLMISVAGLASLVVAFVVWANVSPSAPHALVAQTPSEGAPASARFIARPVPSDPSGNCRAEGWTDAATRNAETLQTLVWSPFGRDEVGWEVYAPLIGQEIGAACPADSEAFARAFAAWEARLGLDADGVVDEVAFSALRNAMQTRREFVRATAEGDCPGTPDLITAARLDEGYGGKQVWMRPAALNAYRRMIAAARAEVPEIAADKAMLTIFSGYRSPSADAARCEAEGNCDGIVRARCSAHRTGLAADIVVGAAPGFNVDSSADANRLFMTRTPAYRWLLANASRYGFANYPFEPWHWEWTGEAP